MGKEDRRQKTGDRISFWEKHQKRMFFGNSGKVDSGRLAVDKIDIVHKLAFEVVLNIIRLKIKL